MSKFRRRRRSTVAEPTRSDFGVRNLLDDPALRLAMGLDGADTDGTAEQSAATACA
jgi:hypothetical protein